MRLIVQSRTYQLSSRTNATNEADETNYSHARPRPLDAEVLLDAICDVTGVPEVFRTNNNQGGAAPPGTRAIQLKETDNWYSPFLDIYGRPNRLSVPERNAKPNISQAQHILAGSTYNDKLLAKEGRLARLIERGASDREIIEEIYLAGFSRFPTREERAELEKLIAQTPSREEALRDLLWAVISSREFAENH
jgi:hypothetical protein